MRYVQLFILAILVTIGFIEANDRQNISDDLSKKMLNEGPGGKSECW